MGIRRFLLHSHSSHSSVCSWHIYLTQSMLFNITGALPASATFCSATCIVALGITLTQHACNAMHIVNGLLYNQSCCRGLDHNCDQPMSTATSVVDDITYFCARELSWMQTTVVDGHKFSVVRHLSQRLLDGRSFVCYCGQGSSLLWTPALRPLCRSNAPAQGEEGNW